MRSATSPSYRNRRLYCGSKKKKATSEPFRERDARIFYFPSRNTDAGFLLKAMFPATRKPASNCSTFIHLKRLKIGTNYSKHPVYIYMRIATHRHMPQPRRCGRSYLTFDVFSVFPLVSLCGDPSDIRCVQCVSSSVTVW